MKDIRTLTRVQLLKAIESSDKRARALCDEFIGMGRGHETPDEIAKCTDGASRVFMHAHHEEMELRIESRRRMEYSGTQHPIRESA